MKFNFAIVVLAIALIVGCASHQSGLSKSSQPTATCEVCRYNNDLGCVCFRLKENTPRVAYQNTNYFFCSESCQQTFQKHPEKYTKH